MFFSDFERIPNGGPLGNIHAPAGGMPEIFAGNPAHRIDYQEIVFYIKCMKRFSLQTYQTGELPLMVWLCREKIFWQSKHQHDCYEIMFIGSGSGVCRINDRIYPLLRGDFYAMTPSDVHSFRIESGCEYYNIMFDRSLFSDGEWDEFSRFARFREWFGEGAANACACSMQEHEIVILEQLMQRIEGELRKKEHGYRIAAKSLFFELLLTLMRWSSPVGSARTKTSELTAFSKVNNHINSHLHEPVSNRTLAGIAAVSPNYFSEIFRKWTGTTVSNYVQHLRIEKARRMLEENKLSIVEIANILGFYDSCHFSRMFRKVTGMSPREYRKTSHPAE
jgi:AraC-like DNA-binding protein